MPGTRPPLRAPVVFEAAVRHASFKDAARRPDPEGLAAAAICRTTGIRD